MTESIKKETGLLLKHASIYGMAPIIGRAVSFFMIPLYTSYITPTEYGIMELVQVVVSLLQTVIGMGIVSGIAVFYFEAKDKKDKNAVVSTAFLGLGGMALLTIFILMFFSSMLAELVLDSADLAKYFYVSFAAMGFGVLNDINTNYFRINKKSKTVVIISLSTLIVSVSLNIFFLVYLDMGVWGIFLSTLIVASANLLIVTPLIYSKIGFNVSWDVMKRLLKFGLPLIPSNLASYLVVASDRLFIKQYVSIAETGLYSLGYKFGVLVNNFVTTPFNQIWGPRRLEMFKKGNSEDVFCRIFTYYTFVLILGGLVISVLSRDIVHMMAAEAYWDSYKIIPLITLAHIVFSFFYHFNIGIMVEKKTKYFAYINVINAIVNLALNFILIKRYGIWGAGFSTLISYLLRTSLCFYFSNKLHKIQVEWGRVSVLIGGGIAYYYAIDFVYINNVILSAVAKTGMALTFPILLYLFGFFYKEEKIELGNMIHKLRIKLLHK